MCHAKPVFSSLAAAAILLVACGGSGNQDNPGNPDDAPDPGWSPPPPPGASLVLPICGEDRVPVTDRIAPCAQWPASKQAPTPKTLALLAPGLAPTIELPSLPSLPPQAKSLPVAPTGQPLRIGLGREVAATASPADVQNLLHWQPTAAGGHVAALRFVSPAAHGLRLGVLVRELPAGTVLRTHGDAGQPAAEVTQEALQEMMERHAGDAADARDADATEADIHTWWSPTVHGDAATLEVEIAPGADPGRVHIAVPRLSHQLMPLEQAGEWNGDMHKNGHKNGHKGGHKDGQIGGADGCHVNATCSPDTDLESRATARMVFMKGGNGFLCTGVLLNDAANSATPWFLTANHCVSTQSEASSIETYWFFRSSACNSTRPSPQRVTRSAGADLLYTTVETDATLLRLRDAPPPGVAWAGSWFGGPMRLGNNTLVGLHHPGGDLQKFSAGTLTDFSACAQNSCTPTPQSRAGYWEVQWQQGTTEGGSSGSALFVRLDGVHYVAGQLKGGNASCSNPRGVDFYGRFDRAYPSLKRWLNP